MLPCLDSLRLVEGPLRQVIVVENGSGDGSAARIREWAAREGLPLSDEGETANSRDSWLVLLELTENRGYAAGNNAGLAWARAAGAYTHLWLLNPDVIVPPTALLAMMARFKAVPTAGLCGAVLADLDAPHQVQCIGGARFDRRMARPRDLGAGLSLSDVEDAAFRESQLGYIMGACCLATRAFVQAAGPMDERFFLYFEEAAWVAAAGHAFDLVVAKNAIIFHRRHAAGGRQEAYLFGNRLRYARYYALHFLVFTMAGLIGTALAALARGEWRRVRLLLSPRLWAYGFSLSTKP